MIIAMTNIRVIVVELIISQMLICRIENMPKQYLKLSVVDVQKFPNFQPQFARAHSLLWLSPQGVGALSKF